MSTAAKTEYSGKQKAAIFLLTVGPDVASDIMKRLSEAEVDTLTYEIARLDKIRPEDKERVLQEFQELMMAQEFISRGGIDQARAILEKALGTQKAIDIVKGLTAEPEVGSFYMGTVRRIVEFGAFVEILPGTDGLVHISELANERVHNVADVVKEGDEVLVKVVGIDRTGKIRLSRKEALGQQPDQVLNMR